MGKVRVIFNLSSVDSSAPFWRTPLSPIPRAPGTASFLLDLIQLSAAPDKSAHLVSRKQRVTAEERNDTEIMWARALASHPPAAVSKNLKLTFPCLSELPDNLPNSLEGGMPETTQTGRPRTQSSGRAPPPGHCPQAPASWGPARDWAQHPCIPPVRPAWQNTLIDPSGFSVKRRLVFSPV